MSVKRKKIAVVSQKECVACGNCVLYCPRSAIHIENGLYAVVEPKGCVGCGRCRAACPASVIQMEEVNSP